jgi:hypothetical protein
VNSSCRAVGRYHEREFRVFIKAMLVRNVLHMETGLYFVLPWNSRSEGRRQLDVGHNCGVLL